MRTCIIPGSFDPMTLGHRNVVERACRLFDRVVVAIMYNEAKKGRFSYEDRLEAARLTLKDLPVEITVKDGYLADFAAEIGACAYVKGVRNAADLAYENNMAEFNIRRNPYCETVYLPADAGLSEISSTEVWRRLRNGEDVSAFLAPEAEAYLRSRMQ